jgi:DNA-binding NtrC family response regulator
MSERILIVDDDASFRRVVVYSLHEEGHETASFGDPEEALHAFAASGFSLVITDMHMPQLSGVDLLTRMLAIAPDVPVIIVTGHPDVNDALDAMREGAFDYLQKPVSRDELKLVVQRGLEARKLEQKDLALPRAPLRP